MSKFFVVKFLNERDKLAHVAVYIEDATCWNLSGRYSKANYMARKGNDLKDVSSSCMTDSFNYMLLNTNKEDWKQIICEKDLELVRAQDLKLIYNKELMKSGFQITSTRRSGHDKNVRTNVVSPRWASNKKYFNPHELNYNKFKRFCERCSVGLNIEYKTFIKNVNDFYKKIVYVSNNEKVSRYDVWFSFKELK